MKPQRSGSLPSITSMLFGSAPQQQAEAITDPASQFFNTEKFVLNDDPFAYVPLDSLQTCMVAPLYSIMTQV
jgi:hypothetical protein